MQQEDKSTTSQTAKTDATSQAEESKETKDATRPWEECKKEGPVLLKVVVTNKSEDKDLKVWCRLAARDPKDLSGLNVTLPLSMKKAYLNAKNQKVLQTLLKLDATKPYFFASPKDIKVELEVTVRNQDDAG